MTDDFSYEIRVLMCTQCGGPLDADIRGGTVECGYCGVTNRIVPRAEASLGGGELDEEVRMSRLRAQDGRPIPPPADVAALLSNGVLIPRKLDQAVKAFNGTRQAVASSSDAAASERLTFLALVLYNHYVKENDPKRQRALLESAAEALELPHHKQFVLAILSRSAVKDHDLPAAKNWLDPCDPRSDDLRADTAYRVSRALIDTAEGNFVRVHKLLGAGQKDVPIADGFHPLATILRANAWEKEGRADMARALLAEYLKAGGPYGVESLRFVLGIYPRLELCKQSMPSGPPSGGQTAY